jgi:hypothetical protein
MYNGLVEGKFGQADQQLERCFLKIYGHFWQPFFLQKLTSEATSRTKLRVSKVAVCCFSLGICYDFYIVKTAAGG